MNSIKNISLSILVFLLLLIQTKTFASCPSTNDLTTFYNENNGQAGIMFDIRALNDVTILCFDVNLYTGTNQYQIYYKQGSHVGFEVNPGAWTLVGGPVSVTSNGTNVPTYIPIPVNVSISAGQSAAFYITANRTLSPSGGTEYTNGTGVGNVLAADANIEILEGTGKAWSYSTNFTPRQFNGAVYYDYCTIYPHVENVTAKNPTCENINGQISVTADGVLQPFMYALNGGTPQADSVFTGLDIGVYNVSVINTEGCATTVDLIVLNESVTPSVDVSDTTVCYGEDAVLTATGNGEVIRWYAQADLDSTSLLHQGEIFHTGETDIGTYTYYVNSSDTSSNCYGDAETVTLHIVGLPPPPEVTNDTICIGSGVQPMISAQGDSIVWFAIEPDTIIPVHTGMNYSPELSGSGKFDFYVKQIDTLWGCVSDFAEVHVLIEEMFIELHADNISCFGENDGQIQVEIQDGTPPYTYSIEPQAGNQQDNTFTDLPEGKYVITVQDDVGCMAMDSAVITEPELLTVQTTVYDVNCYGNQNGGISVQASGGTGMASYTYEWSDPNLNQTYYNVNLPAGIYQVTVTDGNACEEILELEVHSPPPVLVDIFVDPASGSDHIINAGESVQLLTETETITASGTFSWSPEETLSCSGCPDPVASPLSSTTYEVVFTDDDGCRANDSILIEVLFSDIYVPNAFSPGKGNENSYFSVFGNGIDEISLRVYSRWGELVFEGNHPDDKWDGTNSGNELPSGTYVYTVRVTFYDGTSKNKNGSVVLIR